MSNTRPDGKYCQATRKDGTPCTGRPLANGRCFAHQAETAEWRARGGQNRSNAVRAEKELPPRLRLVADLLQRVMVETYQGKLDPKRATALATVASALVRVVQAGELEERVKQLEQIAKESGAA